ITWPATVNTTVTDNLGVNPDSVRVDWTLNGSPRQTFYLLRIPSTNNYSRAFPSDTTQVIVGDQVAYHITARDIANVPNVSRSPVSGENTFTLIASRGNVLVLDDDELAAKGETKIVPSPDAKGQMIVVQDAARPPGNVGLSANAIAAALNAVG